MSVFDTFDAYRPVLWLLSAAGFFGINGVFAYHLILHPELVAGAMSNPVSLVFLAEAFMLLAFGAWAIAVSGLRRPGWVWFIVLSLAGSLAFAVPFFVLLHLRKRDRARDV